VAHGVLARQAGSLRETKQHDVPLLNAARDQIGHEVVDHAQSR
jgi:hypothetical protein